MKNTLPLVMCFFYTIFSSNIRRFSQSIEGYIQEKVDIYCKEKIVERRIGLMKIHIVQRNDTFDSIAEKYNVSVQDLIGMNTHINHLTPLVPGLKVKVPSPVRKDEPSVAQNIQKYYPNIDQETINLQTASTAESVGVKTTPVQKVEVTESHMLSEQPQITTKVAQKPVENMTAFVTEEPVKKSTNAYEEVTTIPLKQVQTQAEEIKAPNDGVKVTSTQKTMEEYLVNMNKSYYQGPSTYTTTNYQVPNVPQMTFSYTPTPYPSLPTPYTIPYPPVCGMPRGPEDERFIIGGFGYPFYGGFGWGGYPFFGGYGWGYPFYGGYGWGRPNYGWGYGHRGPTCSGSYSYY